MKTPSKQLIIFDFDNTLVDNDTDMELIELFPQDKRLDIYNKMDELVDDWIVFMKYVYKEMIRSNISINDINSKLHSIQLSPKFEELLQYLYKNKDEYEVIIVSGANTYAIYTILDKLQITYVFDGIYANPAFQDDEELIHVDKYHKHSCMKCDSCMCKGEFMKEFLIDKEGYYKRIIFVCDGGNDLCLASKMKSKEDIVFVRKEYRLYKKLFQKGMRKDIKCNVCVWENGIDILNVLRKYNK